MSIWMIVGLVLITILLYRSTKQRTVDTYNPEDWEPDGIEGIKYPPYTEKEKE